MPESIAKVAIVTGSTQGLGEAIARELIAQKLIGSLVICGRRAAAGQKLAEEFTGLGCDTRFVAADLAWVDDCAKVVATARDTFGRVDYLVEQRRHERAGDDPRLIA